MKICHQFALAAALVMGSSVSAFAQSTTFQNGNFSNGLTGWDTLGDVSVQLFGPSTNRNPRAVLTTAFLDGGLEEDDNKSGTAAADISLIEPFAGVPPFGLDLGGPAFEGSAIRQSFQVMAGDAINFNFWFSLLSQ